MPLPTGVVTFLFTDIEGSTRLLERHPSRYRDAVGRHHALLREAIEGYRGYIFETVGDAVYAAFSSAADAVAGALRAQRALQSEPWGELGELKVRMGLHTGEVELQADHYFGAALYRCARMTSAAHGGQVVVSSATAELVRDGLPAGVDLRDLGEHRLKDLQRAERIFQLLSAGLAADFPPLRTLGELPNNLPVQPTPFIGRAREVENARRLLGRPDTRVLTLTGPGGVGKTRLGLQVAADALDQFRDGAFFVPLAALLSADLVIPAIAKALGVQESNRPLLESLRDYLRERNVLLVLDNFEHVLVAAAQVADLLATSERVKALVTSREGLHLRGEQQLPVPPLAVPDRSGVETIEELTRYEAVRLFVDRAQAVKLDFAVSDHSVPAVAEICHRLDGLPLAIELAAARIKVFSPQSMLARLDRRLNVLTSGPRDLPARQQTLRQTIAWSYDLLLPEEQIVFRGLGVFGGGCTLESADAVIQVTRPDVDVLAGIASLVDKSLLRRDEDARGEARFRMLETIREYAVERLADLGEAERLHARHADHYLALAEQAEPGLIGASQAAWFDRLEEEHDNLSTALHWLAQREAADHGLRLWAALRRFWRGRGYVTEARERLAELLSLPGAGERGASRAKALHGAGWLAREQGDYGEAGAFFEESLAIYRELGDPRGVGWALIDLGFLTRYQGTYAAARALLEEALGLLKQVGDTEGIAVCLGNLGLIARDEGDPERAQIHLEESLTLWRGLGDRVGIGWALTGLGMVVRALGKLDAARPYLEESLRVWRELGDRQNAANALTTLARLARDQREHDAARACLKESLAMFADVGDRRGIAFVLEGFAGLAADEGQGVRALRLAAAAAALRDLIGAAAPPAWTTDIERSLEAASVGLGGDAIAEATVQGRALTLPEAISFALESTR